MSAIALRAIIPYYIINGHAIQDQDGCKTYARYRPDLMTIQHQKPYKLERQTFGYIMAQFGSMRFKSFSCKPHRFGFGKNAPKL